MNMRKIYQTIEDFAGEAKAANVKELFFSVEFSSADAQDVRAGALVLGRRLLASLILSCPAGENVSLTYQEAIAQDFAAVQADDAAFKGKAEEAAKKRLEEVKAALPEIVKIFPGGVL